MTPRAALAFSVMPNQPHGSHSEAMSALTDWADAHAASMTVTKRSDGQPSELRFEIDDLALVVKLMSFEGKTFLSVETRVRQEQDASTLLAQCEVLLSSLTRLDAADTLALAARLVELRRKPDLESLTALHTELSRRYAT